MRIPSLLWCFFLLPVLSGVLLWLCWPPLPLTFLVFVGFIPLLIAVDKIEINYKRYIAFKTWLAVYTSLIIWNVCTTWWVSNTYSGTHEISSLIAGLFANFANAALMSIPFMLYRYTRKYAGVRAGYISFAAYWMSFEFIHLRWELTWPWLSLGNVFALNHTWIQWYEYTGVFGGTLWVIVINLLIYYLIRPYIFSSDVKLNKKYNSVLRKYSLHIAIVLLIILPIIISMVIYKNVTDKGTAVNVTVLQPNFNPYHSKFDLPVKTQMDKMLSLSKQKLSDTTDYLVWPETSVPNEIWLNNINRTPQIKMLRSLTDSFPNLTTIVGINGFEEYESREKRTVTSRELINPRTNDTLWFDAFNTAIQIDTGKDIEIYQKSKLVPGVERMPYPQFFHLLEGLALDMGGMTGTLGTQKEREVFFNKDSVGIATAICYESVFGEYITRYINNGANLIFIITNDGWWGNTDGHIQHCLYAKLRAIETRKSIARSANTGISCYINQRGDISQPTGWEVDAVLNQTLYANNMKTFYVRNGDYIGRAACAFAVLFLIMSIINKRMYKQQGKSNKYFNYK